MSFNSDLVKMFPNLSVANSIKMISDDVFDGAKWISAEVVGGPQTLAPAPLFRKSFTLNEPVESAVLHITALGLYTCEINGVRVGDHELAPGWTDYRIRCAYQSYVLDSLKVGENVIGVTLGEGWYSGYVGWWARQNYGDRPKFIASITVFLKSGERQIIRTDFTWKTKCGPIISNDLLMGESYDARLELNGWSSAGYDASFWSTSVEAEVPPIILEKSKCPPVKAIEVLTPRSTSQIKERTYPATVFDFGQNLSGRACIALEAGRGTTVTIRYGEALNPDGSVYFENLRGAKATDYYTCKGDGVETWEPRFTYHGFRYVEISGIPLSNSIKVFAVVLHSATERTGRFSCSNPLINQLYSNIVWSQKGNFIEVPTDCPQRDERLGWTGDAQVFLATAAFNMDVKGFFEKWLQDMRDAQTASGAIPCVVPRAVGADMIPFEDGGPGWSDAAIICPWVFYLSYGDATILSDCYEMMSRYMDFVVRERCLGHIRSHREVDAWGGYGDWLALDGSGRLDGGTPRDLIGTAYHANNAALMSRIATLLGKTADADRYAVMHLDIVAAFQNRFVTPKGLISSGKQTSYVLALHFDLIPPDSRESSFNELIYEIERRDFHIATGFVGTPYILDVLERFGRLDIAYKLLEQTSFPSWLFSVENGATTTWERWDGWTKEKGFQEKGMNSFNHYAYGAVGAWMVRSVAGLGLAEDMPGYEKIIFRPRPGGTITQAAAELRTKYGRTKIDWKLDGDGLKVKVSVPPNCTATIDALQAIGK